MPVMRNACEYRRSRANWFCGVLIARRIPGKDEWITAEYWPPSDTSDEYRLVEPLVPLKLAAIALGLSRSTFTCRA